ncbi:hypothetical protein GCM10009546_30540 [Actinomadura livida]|uniref:Uncharacterized protein n=1 Tax=Actinomadura livida TaxID=79909 RepID=A0ABP3PJR8_9ACTN|nr:hypothetical protein GCM10010208_32650 [Actinomadura livida]
MVWDGGAAACLEAFWGKQKAWALRCRGFRWEPPDSDRTHRMVGYTQVDLISQSRVVESAPDAGAAQSEPGHPRGKDERVIGSSSERRRVRYA